MHGAGEGTIVPEQLPTAAWALAWSFVTGQVVSLLERGAQDESAWPLSMLVGALLVGFFSYGVLRARMVRFVIVVVVVVLGTGVEIADLLSGGGGWAMMGTLVCASQLACLVWFSRTPWFTWQRTRPAGGPSLAALLLLAVVVGVLAGVVGADSSGLHVEVRV